MQLIILAAATATVVMTLSQSSFGDKFQALFIHEGGFLEALFKCPYCLSHWVAAILTFISGNGLLMWLAVVAVSQIFIIPINMVLNATYSSEED